MKRLTEAESSVPLTLRVPAALKERLEAAAHQRRERPSTLVRAALEAFLQASSVQRQREASERPASALRDRIAALAPKPVVAPTPNDLPFSKHRQATHDMRA